ncbi:hypothetical protein [Kineosporia babensis]|uniref:Uncharacterized protein n=1 Tax=Kineosporia babensis TaxID=499548 RepID=A0A9X1NFB9_9ACTN|nr:hypothetical protein [Kineosporia babensis]MCD5312048.1 hypothetical protein [Kineosporia babensis]
MHEPPRSLPLVREESVNGLALGPAVPGHTVVYASGDGSVVAEGRTPSMSERLTIRRRYLVDVTVKRSTFYYQLAALRSAFFFGAEVNVSWFVDRPGLAVSQNLGDGQQFLTERLRSLMWPLSSQFEAHQAHEATAAINARFGARTGRMPEGITIQTCFVMLTIDSRLGQQMVEDEIGARKVEAVNLAMRGDPSGLAVHIANNPGDSRAVIDLVSKNRQIDRDTRLELLRLLQSNNGLQDVDLAAVRQRLLGDLSALSADEGPPPAQLNGSSRPGPPPPPEDEPYDQDYA